MRQDALTGDWITMAASRQGRVHLPAADADPLAPQTPTNPSEIPDDYEVAVFENRSPAFGPGLAGDVDASADGGAAAVGRCEVVCFGPEHEGSFASQTPARARTIVDAWAHRTAALQAMDGIEQVFVFENRGVEIGVTLHHPHGQIYGYPYVTPRTQRLLAQRDLLGSGMQTAMLASELDGPRVVAQTEHWVAFVPFAARWPIELHVMPRRPVPDLPSLDGAERDDLATLSLRLLGAVDALYDTPTPYIAAWHQAPVQDRDVHLTWQITSPRRAADRLKFTAGSEAAMGAWVGDVLPEAQAEQLRAALETIDA
jgi:UDPglucose--hexose-1-phosphate uridylyltransferase